METVGQGHLPTVQLLSSISKEVMKIGGTIITKASSKHHQLPPFHSKRQNENISALVKVLNGYVP